MLTNNTLRIFLVNEDVFSLTMHQQLLKNMGYTDIRVFSGEQECLNAIHELPDVILLNCSLHIQPCIEMLKTIKHSFPGIYVVFVGSNENRDVINGILKQGAFEYIISGPEDILKVQAVFHKIQQIQSLLKTKPGLYKGKKDNNKPL